MKIKGIDCNNYVVGYLTAALWSSTISHDPDCIDEDGLLDVAEDHPLHGIADGDAFDSHFGFEDLSVEAVQEAVAVCDEFAKCLDKIKCEDSDEFDREGNPLSDLTVWEALNDKAIGDDYIGHDIWLTRNGHGAGFWDRGYPDHLQRIACAACKALGERNVWVDDNGVVSFDL